MNNPLLQSLLLGLATEDDDATDAAFAARASAVAGGVPPAVPPPAADPDDAEDARFALRAGAVGPGDYLIPPAVAPAPPTPAARYFRSGFPVPFDFREDEHPRDDRGRFVDKEAMEWAKSDPELAAELRSEVTDPAQRAKLDRIIGPAAGPAPAPRPAHRVPPAPSPAHAAFAAPLVAAVLATPGLDPKKAAARAAAVQSVVHSLPPAALQRLVTSGFGGIESVASQQELTAAHARDNPKMRNVSGRVAGYYRTRDCAVVMDGGNETHGIGEFDHFRATFAHELGHVLDAGADKVAWDWSQEDEWLDAVRAEIDRDDAPLSQYARTNEVEGLAEFCRLLWGSNVPRQQVAAAFPRCFAFFQQRGLA